MNNSEGTTGGQNYELGHHSLSMDVIPRMVPNKQRMDGTEPSRRQEGGQLEAPSEKQKRLRILAKAGCNSAPTLRECEQPGEDGRKRSSAQKGR